MAWSHALGFGQGHFRVQSVPILQSTLPTHHAMLRRMKYVILGLGPTETEIMEALWAHGPLTVRQVRAMIQTHRPIAHTTILTLSSRMEEKGLITRHTTGTAYNGARLLTPAITRVELLTQTVRESCRSLNASAADRAAVLDALSNADA